MRAAYLALGVLVVIWWSGCGGTGPAPAFSVTTTTPADGSTEVALTAVVQFTFSRAADPASLTWTSTPPIEAGASWSAASTRLTLTPVAALAPATLYRVAITRLLSADGSPLEGDTEVSFTTAADGGGQAYVVWRYTGGDAKPPLVAFRTPARPAKGASVYDPNFHTSVTRVTDRIVDGYTSEGIVNEYSRADPENANGTRALLRGTDGEWYLYALPTFEHLGPVSFRGNPDPEPRWDDEDPSIVYFVEGPCLWRRHIGTGNDTVVHDFSADESRCAIVRTRFEGAPSYDRRYWCLRLEDENFNLLSVVCYDMAENRILGRLTSFDPECDWVGMSPSGMYCIVAGGETVPNRSYHRDFTHPVNLPAGLGHADVTQTSDGRDVIAYQNASTDWIAMADLETGEETNLIPIPFSDNPDIGLHISGHCSAKPGWVLVSTYGENAAALSWMDRCLFMLQLAENPLIWRIAQTFCIREAGLEKDYFGEAFASVNTAGTRVWWGSNWNDAGAGVHEYDTYVAELPSNWDTAVFEH